LKGPPIEDILELLTKLSKGEKIEENKFEVKKSDEELTKLKIQMEIENQKMEIEKQKMELEKLRNQSNDKKKTVHRLVYGDNSWVIVLREKKSKSLDTYTTANNITDFIKNIKKSIEENSGYFVSTVSFGNDIWTCILSLDTTTEEEILIHNENLIELYVEIQNKYEENFTTHEIIFGQNCWFAVMKKSNSKFHENIVQSDDLNDFLFKIRREEAKNRNIHSITFGNKVWIAILKNDEESKSDPIEHKNMKTFLKKIQHEREEEGKKLKTIAHGNENWVVFMHVVKKDFEEDIITETDIINTLSIIYGK
jgi:hypothetical protein